MNIFEINSIGNYNPYNRQLESREQEELAFRNYILNTCVDNPEILMDCVTFDMYVKVKYRVYQRDTDNADKYQLVAHYRVNSKCTYEINTNEANRGGYKLITINQLYDIVKYEWRMILVEARNILRKNSKEIPYYPSRYEEFTAEWVYNHLSTFTRLHLDRKMIDEVNTKHGFWLKDLNIPSLGEFPTILPVRTINDGLLDIPKVDLSQYTDIDDSDKYRFVTSIDTDKHIRVSRGDIYEDGSSIKTYVEIGDGRSYEVIKVSSDSIFGQLINGIANHLEKTSVTPDEYGLYTQYIESGDYYILVPSITSHERYISKREKKYLKEYEDNMIKSREEFKRRVEKSNSEKKKELENQKLINTSDNSSPGNGLKEFGLEELPFN